MSVRMTALLWRLTVVFFLFETYILVLVYRDPEHDLFKEYRGRERASGIQWHSDVVSFFVGERDLAFHFELTLYVVFFLVVRKTATWNYILLHSGPGTWLIFQRGFISAYSSSA